MWLAWLVRLRWVAVVAQLITLSFSASVLHQPVATIPALLLVVGGLVAANVQAGGTLRAGLPVSHDHLLVHLLLDVTALTAFFAAAGGSANPFVMLYMIHVAMGAVMLERRHALFLMAVVVLANMLLHRVSQPLHLDRHNLLDADTLAGIGQTVALTVTVFSVGLFTAGTAATLRRNKQRLLEARERTSATDRLRAVGTLAAGAAHELNTPLSTMDLRLRRIGRRHTDEATTADLTVIQDQLDRCIGVVHQLVVGAGDPSASGFRAASLQSLVHDAVHLWSVGSTTRVQLSLDDTAVPVELPDIAFTQALANLLQNASEAQADTGIQEPIAVEVSREGHLGVVRVIDQGPGLPDQRDRVGEPFYTTKPQGTGLGVFVARAVAEGAGGTLTYHREQGRTVARWCFPITERTS